MAVNPTGSSTAAPLVPSDKVGFAGLTSEHFLKLLITELQNQDPLQPMGNEELLNQLSMMRNLQSSVELSQTLKGLAGSQELSTAASFIGKEVAGTTTENESVTGVADRVFMADGTVYLSVNDKTIPLSQVASVGLTD